MGTFVTDKELADIVSDIINEIWKAKNELRAEFRAEIKAEIKQLEMNMLVRFDRLTDRWEEFEERIDKKHAARFDSLEKDVRILKKNVALILKIVSKNGGKQKR